MVKITLDGREFEVKEGLNIIEAAKSVGVEIPHFCYHPHLRVVGQCRICLVEIEGIPKLQPACSTPVKEGMVIHTENERVTHLRSQVLEFLLINHPLDCPICDQAGECDLQDFTEEHAFPKSRYTEDKRIYPGLERRKLGPHVFQNMNRCIHCSRCIRFCEDIAETGELTFAERGYRMIVDTQNGHPLENAWSACTADLCPVGALTVYDSRFKERPWNLTPSPSICPHCGNGCAILLDHRSGVVKRIRPDRNDAINATWLCDHGRFSYAWMNAGTIFEPRIGSEIASRDEALAGAREAFDDAKKRVAVVTPFQTNEEMILLRDLFDEVYIAHTEGAERRIKNGERAWQRSTSTGPNAAGAKILGIEPFTKVPEGTDFLFIAENPYPSPMTREAIDSLPEGLVVVADTRAETPLAERADILLPGTLFHEKAGSYVSDHGWVQWVESSIDPPIGIGTMIDTLARISGRDPMGAREIFASIDVFEDKLPQKVEVPRG